MHDGGGHDGGGDDGVVETMGFEPTTPGLQSRCSARLSYVPVGGSLWPKAVLSETPTGC